MPVSDWNNKLLAGEKMHRIESREYDPATETVTDVEGRAWRIQRDYQDSFTDFKSVMHFTASGHGVGAYWYEAE
jgi:hypothetical protein